MACAVSVPVNADDVKRAHADTVVGLTDGYEYGVGDQYDDYYGDDGGGGSFENLDEYIYASDEEEDVDQFVEDEIRRG